MSASTMAIDDGARRPPHGATHETSPAIDAEDDEGAILARRKLFIVAALSGTLGIAACSSDVSREPGSGGDPQGGGGAGGGGVGGVGGPQPCLDPGPGSGGFGGAGGPEPCLEPGPGGGG